MYSGQENEEGAQLMKSFKFSIAVLIITLGATPALYANAENSSGKDSCPYKNMRDAIDTISARETVHEWQKIQWRTSAATALADAQKESKPIFVFFVVKQKASSPTSWVGKESDLGKT
jgi:hypothetical protein